MTWTPSRFFLVAITAQTSQADHIVPVRRFASFALASKTENVQTLCLDCHGQKHRVKPR